MNAREKTNNAAAKVGTKYETLFALLRVILVFNDHT